MMATKYYRSLPGKIIKCRQCGKFVRTRIPKKGDGTAIVPVWHKNWSKEPCEGRFDTLDYFGNPA